MKTVEQAIYDSLWKITAPLVGENIHSSRPMNDVGYPFSDFEDFDTGFTGTKNGTTAKVIARLNIWDTEKNRKRVSDICSQIFRESMKFRNLYGFPVSLRVSNSGIRILEDKTVKPSLWRGIVTLEFDI